MFSKLTLVFFCFSSVCFGQFRSFRIDTLKPDYRISGNSLDSMDFFRAETVSSVPGLLGSFTPELNLINRFDATNPFLSNFLSNKFRTIRFIALPHFGFHYTFGTKESQQLKAEFQLNRLNSYLQIQILRSARAGFLQNGTEKASQFQLNYGFNKNRYNFSLDGVYASRITGENGGIKQDSLINQLSLALLDVNKGSAESILKRGTARMENSFSFSDSANLNKNGLILKTEYDIFNRIYTESGDLNQFYSKINFDSIQTRDQLNVAKIKNGFGYFLATPNFYLDAVYSLNYWNQQNLSKRTDTLEQGIEARFGFKNNRLNLQNESYVNLINATGEWSNNLTSNFILNSKIRLNGSMEIGAKLPASFLRNYRGNNVNWTNKSITTQKFQQIQIGMQSDSLMGLTATVTYFAIQNAMIFKDSNFTQNGGSQSVFQGKIGIRLSFNKLNINPYLVFQGFTGNLRGPQLIAKTRIHVKTSWLKKRLPVLYGIDFAANSKYKTFALNPMLGQFNTDNQLLNGGGLMKVDAFFGFELKTFRFSFRAENIDYFWNKKTVELGRNYPVLPLILRFGIAMDFFN